MNKNVICCGNIAFDLIAAKSNDKGSFTFEARPGGSVFNTAIQLSRLGLPVSMVAKSGNDFLADSLFRVMKRERIETRYVIKDPEIETGLAFATIDKKGNPSYLFYKTQGPQLLLKKDAPPSSLFKRSAVFHTGSQHSYNNYSCEDTLALIKRANHTGLFTTYDPNWRPNRIKNKKIRRARIKKILEYVDLVKLSDSDATGITGAKTLSAALKRLPEKSIVTLGEKGSFFWDGKKRISCPAFKVRVVDTIGAGDAFTAGLIYKFCRNGKKVFWENMKENLTFASAVSAIVCTGRGATETLHSANQVQRFLTS